MQDWSTVLNDSSALPVSCQMYRSETNLSTAGKDGKDDQSFDKTTLFPSIAWRNYSTTVIHFGFTFASDN